MTLPAVAAADIATVGQRAATPGLSCVVPAYNEAANLDALLRSLVAELTRLTPLWELIVVDDGSTDGSAQVLRPWLQQPGIRCVRLSRNFGKEAALTAGIDRAAGDVVLLIDADLQHPPAMIGAMLQAWREGADVVCTARVSRHGESLAKRLGTWMFYRFVNAHSAVRIPVDAGDFRLMDRRVVEALRSLPERNRFMKGLYAWVGFRTVVLPYEPAERAHGHSRYSLRRLARLAFTGVTAFTTTPLRLWSAVGAVAALLALAFGLWIIAEHFIRGHNVPGWATMVAGLMFTAGVQLLSIGILGEYIGRIFDEVKQRPVYIVSEEFGSAALAASRATATPTPPPPPPPPGPP